MRQTLIVGFLVPVLALIIGTGGVAAQPCDDGSLCTTNDTCDTGSCTGAPVTCADDGNACTVEFCDPGTGNCAQQPLDCDDINPCTNDSCDPGIGCVHTSNPGAVCDDALQCTNGDVCRDAVPALVVLPCTNSTQCSLLGGGGTCGPSSICTCSLDSECDPGFVCRFGGCVRTCSTVDDCAIPAQQQCKKLTPDDTVNTCHITLTNAICLGTPMDEGTVCTDAWGSCTQNDRCQVFEANIDGLTIPLPTCVGDAKADGASCTEFPTTACDTPQCIGSSVPDIPVQVSTCVPNPVFCDQDTNMCDTELCNPADGTCMHLPVVCGSECETVNCDPATGCIPEANGTLCNDGNECTSADQCTDGVCGGQPIAAGTSTETPTITATETPTATPTVTPTSATGESPTATPTITPTNTATETPTATPTVTPTSAPGEGTTATPTGTPTATPTITPTSPPTATRTRQPIPVIGSPAGPGGILLILLLGGAMLFALVRRPWRAGR